MMRRRDAPSDSRMPIFPLARDTARQLQDGNIGASDQHQPERKERKTSSASPASSGSPHVSVSA
jgi:hypothetical protein